jgi:ADP-heptose:LPS heptosyltransferase
VEHPDHHGRPVLLVLRALGLGDLLVAVPALRGLRRAFPEHHMIYAGPAWLEPVVRLIGGIDTLMPVQSLETRPDLKTARVDVAVNLHGGGDQSRSWLDALHPERRIGHAGPGWEGAEWNDDLHERLRWTRLLAWHGIEADPLDYRLNPPSPPEAVEPPVVIHVGAAYGSRLWPVERFARVARRFTGAGQQVVFTGSHGERARALEAARLAGIDSSRVVAGRLDMEGFLSLIAAAQLVISADTGAAHLASAFGRPSIILFGPAPVSRWGPPPGPHIVLTDESRRAGDLFAETPDPAMLAVTPDDVINAAVELGVLQGSVAGHIRPGLKAHQTRVEGPSDWGIEGLGEL